MVHLRNQTSDSGFSHGIANRKKKKKGQPDVWVSDVSIWLKSESTVVKREEPERGRDEEPNINFFSFKFFEMPYAAKQCVSVPIPGSRRSRNMRQSRRLWTNYSRCVYCRAS